jgi:hypothetical protein
VGSMACDPLLYSGVDASQWADLRDTIDRQYGIRIDSDRGEASKRGFTLKWAYEPADETLQIQCLEKPFLTPCGVINSFIKGAAQKSGLTSA